MYDFFPLFLFRYEIKKGIGNSSVKFLLFPSDRMIELSTRIFPCCVFSYSSRKIFKKEKAFHGTVYLPERGP